MPLNDRSLLREQRGGVELGRIRIGTRVQRGDRQVPVKLDTFRLTSPSRTKLEAAAALFGGEVRPWDRGSGRLEHEVVTKATELPVRLPPGGGVTAFYELHGGGGLERRCDGLQEQLTGGACLCPRDLGDRRELAGIGRACKPRTRLRMILADLPGLGVWVLTSTGDSAADELAATAELLHALELQGRTLPATLRLEQREARTRGEVRRYAVPVLDVGASLAQLEAGQVPAAPALAAPAPPALTTAVVELEAGDPTAEQLASFAPACQSRGDVLALQERAAAAGHLDELVPDAAGVLTPLADLLRDRYRELPA